MTWDGSVGPAGGLAVGAVVVVVLPPVEDVPPVGEVEPAGGGDPAGGKVTMPLADTFWGARVGMLVDAYGIDWMFNCEKKK